MWTKNLAIYNFFGKNIVFLYRHFLLTLLESENHYINWL